MQALSYVWGPPEPAQMIMVNRQPFIVRQNLWHYLDTVTSRTSPVYQPLLFIDQLCVNQADLGERNHQVHQMANIYRAARQVVCWLGPETSMSSRTMEFLKHTTAATVTMSRAEYDRVRTGRASAEVMAKLGPLHTAMTQLPDLDYWRRVWVIQEFALAPSLFIRWGHRVLSFSTFWSQWSDIRSALGGSSCFAPTALEELCGTREHYEQNLDLPWMNVVLLMMDRDCEEPKDRVFAILGLRKNNTVRPDYSKSAEEIFDEVAREQVDQNTDGEGEIDTLLPELAEQLGVKGPIDISKYMAMWR